MKEQPVVKSPHSVVLPAKGQVTRNPNLLLLKTNYVR